MILNALQSDALDRSRRSRLLLRLFLAENGLAALERVLGLADVRMPIPA
jgi:hypothetical protein